MLADATREAARIVKAARERQNQLVSGYHWFARRSAWPGTSSTTRTTASGRSARARRTTPTTPRHARVNLSRLIAAVERGRERLQGRDEPAEGE
jgi:hypothetical protein